MSADGANTTDIAMIGSNIDVPVPMNRCTGHRIATSSLFQAMKTLSVGLLLCVL